MDRVIAPNTVASPDATPASGTPQYPTNGIPGTQPATTFPAYHYASMMDELINIITGGGGTPSKSDNTQVLAAIKKLIQQETGNYAVDTGAANAYVIAPNPPITSYTDGLPLRFLAAHANTGVSTVAVSGLAAKTIVRDDGSALLAGDIPANGIAEILYSATLGVFVLISTVQENLSVLQAQAGNYAADTGASGAAYACTLSPALGSHKTGMPIRIKAAHTNTGACTFNPGPGAVAIKDEMGADLVAGMIQSGAIVTLVYDGSVYQFFGRVAATTAEVRGLSVPNQMLTPGNISALVHVSSNYTWTGSTQGSEAHNLGAQPLSVRAMLVCITAELGYSAGDIVMVGGPDNGDRGVTCWADGTNVGFAIGASGIDIFGKTGSSATNVTAAKWYIRLVCSLIG